MGDRVFLDTNILIYAYDEHEPQKQRKAQSILSQAIEEEKSVLSAQVLGGFLML